MSTLKDLLNVKEHSDAEMVVKDAAIEMVMAIQMQIDGLPLKNYGSTSLLINQTELGGMKRGIMQFCNITEEDLK